MADRPRMRWDWLGVTLLIGVGAYYVGAVVGLPKAYEAHLATPVSQGERPPLELAPPSDDLPTPPGHARLTSFFRIADPRFPDYPDALADVRAHWHDGYTGMLLEMRRFTGVAPDGSDPIMALIEEKTGQDFNRSQADAYHWLWNRDVEPHPHYGLFKAVLYARIDPRFAAYFDDHTEDALIRLDEVRWGGVRRDGIPPLDRPKMVAANSDEAKYLDDDNVVFGLAIHGDARAYPKRILAWHEMFKDTLGAEGNELSINGVYCTLCGSMIAYHTVHDGVHHELGTSGFLYRSNKLMYDHATESMWSTITGEPVLGPLANRGIRLQPLFVVTTTWGEWKKRHPHTTVLSIDTGHNRNYDEGNAYHEYFATDELMFDVPQRDDRLKNKAEVLALRFGPPGAPPVAIDAEALKATPVFSGDHGGQAYVVLTDPSGANRVYASDGVKFSDYDGNDTATDTSGTAWTLAEDALTAPDGRRLERLAAHRAFWFGWFAAHPDTRLLPEDSQDAVP